MEKKLLIIAVKLLILLGYVVLPKHTAIQEIMFKLEEEFKSLLEEE